MSTLLLQEWKARVLTKTQKLNSIFLKSQQQKRKKVGVVGVDTKERDGIETSLVEVVAAVLGYSSSYAFIPLMVQEEEDQQENKEIMPADKAAAEGKRKEEVGETMSEYEDILTSMQQQEGEEDDDKGYNQSRKESSRATASGVSSLSSSSSSSKRMSIINSKIRIPMEKKGGKKGSSFSFWRTLWLTSYK